MSQPVIQHSFNTGEWAPALNARVDLQKYHSAAALLENFFVDYRGGASTRPGTKYCLQAYKSATPVRLIPFQASFTVGYMLEFGDRYIRFFFQGAPVLEAAVTGGTGASGNTFTITNTYQAGDWVLASNWGGMTNVNGRYFIVASSSGSAITVTDLFGNAVTFTGTYTSGGQLARVYTISSPYAAADLAQIKFAQNVSTLILCHPNYNPQLLTLISANNWSLSTMQIGTTVGTPTNVAVTTSLAAGAVNYAYLVTAADNNGQESAISAAGVLASVQDLRSVAGTNTITWNAVSGATSYNVYKAEPVYGAAVAAGAAFGFIGNCTGTIFNDSNIAQDFSQTPPIVNNPFVGAGVASIAVGTRGTYTTVPTLTISSPGGGGITATGSCTLRVKGTPVLVSSGLGTFAVGDAVNFGNNVIAIVATIDGSGNILTFQPITFPGSNAGSFGSGTVPSNPVAGKNSGGSNCTANLTWEVGTATVTNPGAGYNSVPTVTPSAGAATFVATLSAASSGNPSVVAFFQQRMVLANQPQAVQTFYMSQPGSPYNFNISNPLEASDAITASIVAAQLNEIKAMVPVPTGLMMLTSQANWLVNGGGNNVAITPADAQANAHSFIGSSDLPPIVSNFDILYVQAKGSFVRDLTYNFYANIFTGSDISILSSHLFYGFTLTQWAWAQEPFKVVWATRNDGVMLTLTFMKEQEFIGWSHQTTQGLFNSVATITEAVSFGFVDAVYTVVQRTINSQTVQFIERVAERIFPNGAASAWCVDAALQYSGSPATQMSGWYHLAGQTCTGLADGIVIPPFVMPANGSFTLGAAASTVTVGLSFTPKLQTLAIDTGEPTIQSKMKKIPAVTLRVEDTLGLSIGSSFSTLVPMKDLVVGNIGSMTNQKITDLVTGDVRTRLDPTYTVPGQYCVQQSNPFPASILGVIPELAVGDTAK